MKQKKQRFDGVIFDIDNVLIDTRRSYLDAIRWAIEIYLTEGKIPLFEPAPKKMRPALLSPDDVHRFKLLGGFNDDWDCCYGFLIYLLKLDFDSRTILHLKQKIDLEALAKEASKFAANRMRPIRVDGMIKMLGTSPFVKIEKISRIFQEVYLGKELFKRTERRDCLFWKKKGLIYKEKPIFKPSHCKRLKAHGLKLGIATGRPRFEALYSLHRFGLLPFFEVITSMNEVKKAEIQQKKSLRKPHPYSVIQTAKKMGSSLKLLYVGDLPDDVIAAKRAKSSLNIASAAFVGLSENPKFTLSEMKKIHPDFILRKPGELVKIACR